MMSPFEFQISVFQRSLLTLATQFRSPGF